MSPAPERALSAGLEAVLGDRVASLHPVGGGDVDRAFAVVMAGGERLFAKVASDADRRSADRFRLEARGLAWLAEPRALAVPAVRACLASPPALVLEWIEPGPAARTDALGRGLAALHRAGAPGFGAFPDNFIGPLPQPNDDRPTWARFYAERRIAPMVRRARDAGALDAADARAFEALCAVMEERAGPAEPPARLHGDLWSGNVVDGADGRPWLVDPAAYGGHREMDLAMMRLFGGFPERCFAAYDEAAPLAPGWRERVPLWQLYPLLVHVNLFGGGYRSQLIRALAQVS